MESTLILIVCPAALLLVLLSVSSTCPRPFGWWKTSFGLFENAEPGPRMIFG